MIASTCYQALAPAELEQGRAQAALVLVDEGLELHPEHKALLWCRARACKGLDRPSEALKILHELTAIDPENFFDPAMSYNFSIFQSDSHGLIGSIHFDAGDFQLAATHFEAAAQTAENRKEFTTKAALARAML